MTLDDFPSFLSSCNGILSSTSISCSLCLALLFFNCSSYSLKKLVILLREKMACMIRESVMMLQKKKKGAVFDMLVTTVYKYPSIYA